VIIPFPWSKLSLDVQITYPCSFFGECIARRKEGQRPLVWRDISRFTHFFSQVVNVKKIKSVKTWEQSEKNNSRIFWAQPPYLQLATSEMWYVGLEEGEYKLKLSLSDSIVYCYNGAQRYEQFLQVGWLYRALILLGLALYLPSASVSLVLMVLYRYYFFFAYILLFTF